MGANESDTTVTVTVTVPVKHLLFGTGACEVSHTKASPPPAPALLPHTRLSARSQVPKVIGMLAGKSISDACVSGCCRPGVAADGGAGCECDKPSTRGAHCDQEIKCSAQGGATDVRDTQACTTDAAGLTSDGGGGGRVTCRCTEPRRIAVMAHRVLPKTGVDLAISTQRQGIYARSLQWPIAGAILWIVALLVAGRADRRGVLYAAQPPHWLCGHRRMCFAQRARSASQLSHDEPRAFADGRARAATRRRGSCS